MIEIKNLNFHYKKGKPVFENVSFTMKSGIYGLLGENGVGKTTLLRLISGLRFPIAGTCRIAGLDSAQRNPKTLSQLFYLPEEFGTPPMSIYDYAKYNAPFYPNFSREQFETYLKEINVNGSDKMTQQSFGQKKKAMLAFAFALNTPILLLDEPTNGLDIPSKSQFRKILSMSCGEERCILISSHQVRDLDSLIDPIIILDHNDVLMNHSVEEISRKLIFSLSQEKPENVLYAEQTIAGYASVGVNETGVESTVNIELLFNAIVNNRRKIKELFNF